MAPLGYHGRILRVDLASAELSTQTPDEDFYRIYAGGGLMGAYFLMAETATGLDAFDPDARLMFMSSVIAGNPGPGLPRFSVVAKSPLTGGFGESAAEGPWGNAFKASGFDAIVVRGRAARPMYLLIENGEPSLRPADKLWGTDTGRATDRLEKDHGECHVAVIGPAGENLVRFASIVSDRGFDAPRMGLGAVMGSKHLKAIVLKGGSLPTVADPAMLEAITDRYASTMLDNPLTRAQKIDPGFGAWIGEVGLPGYFAVENYRTSRPLDLSRATAAFRASLVRSEGGCPTCPNDCVKSFRGIKSSDGRAGELHQEACAALGPNLGIGDVPTLIEANILCHLYGLDPVSLGFTLSFLMECVDNRALSPADLGGIDLRFGNAEALLSVIPLVARREGPGVLIAEGVRRASARLGEETAQWAMHVKGLELAVFDPRLQTNLGLGYALASIGPRFHIQEHDWDFDDAAPAWPHPMIRARTLGVRPSPMAKAVPTKIRDMRALNNIWSACDALNLCLYAGPPTRNLSLNQVSQLVRAITGWETSDYEFMRWGERRNHLSRIYNLREGLTSADDQLPDRFFDSPLDAGPFAGKALDRQEFESSRALYYAAMGWDAHGVPTAATRNDHHLEWTMG